jgi:hypothetical protein
MLTGDGIARGKIVTDIWTGVSLMHKVAYPICKEFLQVLPKILYHGLQNMVV